jgi:hypothetical protein
VRNNGLDWASPAPIFAHPRIVRAAASVAAIGRAAMASRQLSLMYLRAMLVGLPPDSYAHGGVDRGWRHVTGGATT